MAKKTVAFYRTQAEKYEKALNWEKAVESLEKAIKNYPKHLGSPLAEADIKGLKERLQADRYMLKQETKNKK